MRQVYLEVTMTIQPLSYEVAKALIGFSQDFAALHNLSIDTCSYQPQKALLLQVKGSADILIKLFLELHQMQQVEQHFSVAC